MNHASYRYHIRTIHHAQYLQRRIYPLLPNSPSTIDDQQMPTILNFEQIQVKPPLSTPFFQQKDVKISQQEETSALKAIDIYENLAKSRVSYIFSYICLIPLPYA